MKAFAQSVRGTAIALLLLASLPLAAAPSRLPVARAGNPSDKAQRTQAFADACDLMLDGIDLVETYIFKRHEKAFTDAQAKFAAAETAFATLLKTAPATPAEARKDLEDLLKSARTYVGMTASDLNERLAKGKRRRFESSAGDVASLGEDGAAALLLGLGIHTAIVESMAEKYGRLTYAHTWQQGAKQVTFVAMHDAAWDAKVANVGLGRYIAVRVDMENRSGRDLQLNPMLHKFTLVTATGRQFANVAPSFADFRALENLGKADRQQVYDALFPVYDGATTPLVLLFPRVAFDEEPWKAIVFDSTFGATGGGLTKARLLPR